MIEEGQSLCCILGFFQAVHGTLNTISRASDGGQNPGNNLHVSGLSHKVDTRDLEAAFAKIGRVSICFFTHLFLGCNGWTGVRLLSCSVVILQ